MARVKHAVARRKRHSKILKLAKGYRGGRGRLYRTALETIKRALVYNYRDRKVRKRLFRRLWITRISVACKNEGISYSKLIYGLNKAGIQMDRKNLAEMAVNDSDSFKKVVTIAKEQNAD